MVLLTANTFSLQGAPPPSPPSPLLLGPGSTDAYTPLSPPLADHIARLLSDYFTSGSGITVLFESALVPNLFASTITLHNVFVSRRPKSSSHLSPADAGREAHAAAVEAAEVAAAAAAASAGAGGRAADKGFKFGPEDHREHQPDGALFAEDDADDGNYTQFDLHIDRIEVELSFVQWLNGEGLVKAAVVSGVRGVLGAPPHPLPSPPLLSVLPRASDLHPLSPRRPPDRPPLGPLGRLQPVDPARVAPPLLARRRVLLPVKAHRRGRPLHRLPAGRVQAVQRQRVQG